MQPFGVSGYVLAGGRSSRMGRDKALLELAGRPLVAHAVEKLQRVCSEVSILSEDEAHGRYGPLVRDLHPGCGPLGGIEAALEHSSRDWSLILPVDVPFLPTAMLDCWVRETLAQNWARLAMFVVDGRPQPALLMIHREVRSYVSSALGRGEYKLLPVLMGAADDLARRSGIAAEQVLRRTDWGMNSRFVTEKGPGGEAWRRLTETQETADHLYFRNLNTGEEFAEAALFVAALDT